MYHPFCAKVTYKSGYKCIAPNCSDKLVDPDWHCSFGWGAPGSLVVEDAAPCMMLCNKKVVRFPTEWDEQACLRCPNIGKYCACNFLVPIFCDALHCMSGFMIIKLFLLIVLP